MDVHDVGEYEVDGHSRVLERGMALTVEPGIYIPPTATAVDETWRGMGIRIEDNVVVTGGECNVLTSGICKTVDEIEQLMAS
jgi:Xaa-Pro aminopeptidase